MFEIGIGESGILHSELLAWQANIGIELKPWECRFIKALAGEYMMELMRARKDVKSPWDGADIDTRALVALQMKESIRGL